MAGHDPGRDTAAPEGFTWGDYLSALVERHGTLTALAWRLCEARGFTDDAGSVERALRRLRTRGHGDGGDWGRRLLRLYGLPRTIAERAQWMGVYHSRFTDLPLSVCRELLGLWQRPPVGESWARVFILLGLANVALRRRDLAQARAHLGQAEAVGGEVPTAARIERLLVGAFCASLAGEREGVAARLDEVGPLLAAPDLAPGDALDFRARWLDQRAWQLTHADPPDPEGARALYASLPEAGLSPFAACRRASGLAWCAYLSGDRAAAVRLGEAAARHAGDGGYLRLRAMALLGLARFTGGAAGEAIRARAAAIAERLEDDLLLSRARAG